MIRIGISQRSLSEHGYDELTTTEVRREPLGLHSLVPDETEHPLHPVLVSLVVALFNPDREGPTVFHFEDDMGKSRSRDSVSEVDGLEEVSEANVHRSTL